MTTAATNFTAANRDFFDDLAAKYDLKPWQKQMSLQITNFIQHNLDFIGVPRQRDPVALLDYACGTGMISRAVGPSVTSIQALDISSKMVERFNELAVASEIPSVRTARAVEGDLLTGQEPPAELNTPGFYNFDVAAVGVGLHHFDDPAKAIGRLAQRLKVGGVLLIVDFVEEGAAEHSQLLTPAEHTIRKHGFSEKEMKEMMEAHGLGGFGWKEMPERVEMKFHEDKPVSRQGFLARATKMVNPSNGSSGRTTRAEEILNDGDGATVIVGDVVDTLAATVGVEITVTDPVAGSPTEVATAAERT